MQLTKWVHEPIWMSKVKVIHWPWSKVTQLQHFIYVFFRNLKPTEAKFHLYPPWDEGTKVCSNGRGHMTSLAAMHIYGKKNKQTKKHEFL